MAVGSAVFGLEEERARKYRGFNPAFVRRVWAERRQSTPQPVKQSKTIGQILAERRDERRAKLEEQRVERLKARIEEGGISAIIAEVALAHRVTVADILGHGRSAPLVKARHQAIIEVAIRRPAFSLTQIGRFFKRDHTSILHVLRKYGIRGTHDDTEA